MVPGHADSREQLPTTGTEQRPGCGVVHLRPIAQQPLLKARRTLTPVVDQAHGSPGLLRLKGPRKGRTPLRRPQQMVLYRLIVHFFRLLRVRPDVGVILLFHSVFLSIF